MKKLYVGNLSFDVSDQDLAALFADYGAVISANIIRDKYDNSSKGFGFVEMENSDEASSAISELDGTSQSGRQIIVNEARPKRDNGGDNRGRSNFGGGERRRY